MPFVYSRHYPPCDHTDIYHRRCRCPKWIQGLVDGKGFVRVSARTRSWEEAELKAREMERVADPLVKPDQPVTIPGISCACNRGNSTHCKSDFSRQHYKLEVRFVVI